MKKSGNTTWLFFLCVTLLFIGFLLVKKNNLVRWIQSAYTVRQQERQINELEREIESVDGQLLQLSTNRDSLETFARENFNFAAPGEDVYLER